MRNKQSKSLKKAKSLTANAVVKHSQKEPHSALAVVAVVAVAVVVAKRAVPKRRAVAAVVKRVLAKRAVQRVRVQVKITARQSTGSKSTWNAPSAKSKILKPQLTTHSKRLKLAQRVFVKKSMPRTVRFGFKAKHMKGTSKLRTKSILAKI